MKQKRNNMLEISKNEVTQIDKVQQLETRLQEKAVKLQTAYNYLIVTSLLLYAAVTITFIALVQLDKYKDTITEQENYINYAHELLQLKEGKH